MSEEGYEAIELLDALRGYLRDRLRSSVARIYFVWALATVVVVLIMEVIYSRFSGLTALILSTAAWILAAVLIIVDISRSFNEAYRLMSLLGMDERAKEMRESGMRVFYGWMLAGFISWPTAIALGYLGLETADPFGILMFVGIGNSLTYLLQRRHVSVEPLTLGLFLIVMALLCLTLPPGLAWPIVFFSIVVGYTIAGLSIYLRWK